MSTFLIVEDGSGVPAANSYVTLAAFRNYALVRGKTLPVDDNACEVLLIAAGEWLETRPRKFVGKPTTLTQGLMWPRTSLFGHEPGVWIDGDLIADTSLPAQLIRAQYMVALIAASGQDLFPIQTGAMITVDKTDVLETHFSDKFGPLNDLVMPAVNAMLAPLFGSSGALLTHRV